MIKVLLADDQSLVRDGFRAIIAPSFADIFHGNCCQNGLLPVVLAETAAAELFRRAAAPGGYELTVDLVHTRVSDRAGFEVGFEIAPYRREMLRVRTRRAITEIVRSG